MKIHRVAEAHYARPRCMGVCSVVLVSLFCLPLHGQGDSYLRLAPRDSPCWPTPLSPTSTIPEI